MNNPVPLILREEPVTRKLLDGMQISKPDIAVVYADAYGEIAYFDGRPLSRTGQVWSRYRTRYEIDISQHHRTAHLESWPLPSRGDAYFFHSEVSVVFRVTDPPAVVRRNVTDALPVVYGYLIDIFRPVTRRHDIRDAQGAETELNHLFQQPVALEEGITIFRCTTRLLPDRAAQQYLHSLETADRSLNVGEAEYRVARAVSRHEHELASMAQQARLEAERREQEAMAGQRIDLEGLLRLHLAKHPGESEYALELLTRHEQAQLAVKDINDQRSMDLVKYMIEQGLIQSADIELLRTQALGRIQQIGSPERPALAPGRPPAGAASSWDERPSWGETSPVTVVHEAPSPQAAASAVLAYIIVDESPMDHDYFEALNDGIQALPADVAKHPGLFDALRLAVLGYASDVAARMQLTTIAPGSSVPPLAHRQGASLSTVFEYLRERIPADVSGLKSRGLAVGRPVVYLLCAAAPEDGSAWEAPYRLLADRAGFPFAPNFLVCGIGEAPPAAVRLIDAQPGSFGWVADPDVPLREAAAHYATFVRQNIIAVGSAHITGSPEAAGNSPEGFRPAGGTA